MKKNKQFNHVRLSVFTLFTITILLINPLLSHSQIESTIELKEIPLDVVAFLKESWDFISDERVLGVEKELEDNATFYEIEFKGRNDDEIISVKTTENGMPIEIEKSIDSEQLPTEVVQALRRTHPTMKIHSSDIVFNVSYEVAGIYNNLFCELTIRGTGEITDKECRLKGEEDD